jgi:biotin carboxylase
MNPLDFVCCAALHQMSGGGMSGPVGTTRLLLGALFLFSIFQSAWVFAKTSDHVGCGPRVLHSGHVAPNGYVLISDAVSSGSLIPEALRERGITAVHVLSTPEMDRDIAESIDMTPYDADKQFVYHGDLDLLAQQTAHLPFRAVLPGGETGVLLADMFAQRLGLVGNGTALSQARRDKFLQIETCAAAGIPVARQQVVSTLYDVFKTDLGLPLVLKPRDAAAGFKVFIESDPRAIMHAFYSTMASVNPLTGKDITDVLLQGYLDGKDEYVVDIAIHDGNVYITDVTRYSKIVFNGAAVVYESEDLLRLEEAENLGLIAYAKRVLVALGIRNGAAHMEIKRTSKGPRLIEVGARMAGGGFPVLVREATGEYPVDAMLDAYLDPQAFMARMERPRKFRAAKVVYLMTEKQGILRGLPYLKQIEALPSFFRHKPNVHIDHAIGPTTNFFDYPGQFELVHDDPEVVESDYRTIRALERRPDFYNVESIAP